MPSRPRSVVAVFVILLIVGILGLIGGLGGLFGGLAASTAPSSEDVAELGAGVTIFAGATLVMAILNILLAFGVFRGSRVARVVVTILQLVSMSLGLYGVIFAGAAPWNAVQSMLLPLAVILLLWTGESTRRFFAGS